MKIRWLGQSGYILSDGTTEICIDPYLSDVVNKVANRPRVREIPIAPEKLKSDIVICTHNHLDHIDTDSIPLMDKRNMTFLAPSECRQVLTDMGVENFEAFDEGRTVKYGDFEITATFADHSVNAVGVLITYKGERLYFSGDTEYNEKLEEIRCDYMFICINGKLGNMNVCEATKLTKIINPKLAIPNHYDMFESNSEDPEKFDVPQRFIMEFDKEYEVIGGCLI